jgi:effector-binding domain-containing protein
VFDAPEILETPAVPAAMIRVTVPRSAIQSAMGPGIQEIMAAVTAQGIGPAGPWFTHHLRMDPATFDFAIGVPVNAPVTPVGRVVAGELPARARVARTVYHGGFEGLALAWAAFDSWLTSEGFEPAPDFWEVYLVGPESGPDSSQWQTQLNRPLAD